MRAQMRWKPLFYEVGDLERDEDFLGRCSRPSAGSGEAEFQATVELGRRRIVAYTFFTSGIVSHCSLGVKRA
jgi:hypothetical protein